MTKICKHCNKGAQHFTEWDEPDGDTNGVGQCLSFYRWGGTVGDWTCNKDRDQFTHNADQQVQIEEPAKSTKEQLEREILALQDELSKKIKQLSSL